MDDADEKRLNLNDTVISVGGGNAGNPPTGVRGRRGEFMDINDALGLPPDENIDIKDDFIIEDDEESLRAAKWNVKMTLRSHLDAIRAMQFHPVEPVLITAGEDGTAKLWNLDGAKEKSGGKDGVICCWNVPSTTGDPYEAYGNFGEPLLRSLDPPSTGLIPTSVDFVSTEPSQLLTAYTSSTATITDIETGATILSFDFGEGKLTHSAVAHVEGISSLAIDPNGLYLLSGSHDGSLRMWNMEKRVCLQLQ
ncbi:WD domain, G-beta repeat protein [Teladorsagia circumcincta]|uniref:WD domain, G-beta repeat protein n=1 Tax=Teladorsagia circumcincta TaxID=45464 RepID=A0A2G9UQB6_TELCI|nr:WD domain, G-beta repeat protein [Teladorsagia circumcincta]